MRTIRVVLTLHAAVRYRSRTLSREPVLRIHHALPKSAVLSGLTLGIPGGTFRLAARPVAGEYTALTFLDAPADSARGERVAVAWEAPKAG